MAGMTQSDYNKRYRQKLSERGTRRVELKVPGYTYEAIQSRLAPKQTVTSYIQAAIHRHLRRKEG